MNPIAAPGPVAWVVGASLLLTLGWWLTQDVGRRGWRVSLRALVLAISLGPVPLQPHSELAPLWFLPAARQAGATALAALAIWWLAALGSLCIARWIALRQLLRQD